MSDTYKLQLRHGAENKTFSTSDEVTAYIQGQLQYGGVSLLPYEPILFFYGEEDAKNAVIMVGLPEGETYNGKKFFLIDTAYLLDKIEEIDGKYDEAIINLQEEDEKIWAAVNQEIADRIDADKEEATIRAEKDEELANSIEEESKIREEKDNELQYALDFTKDDLMSVIEACGLIYNEKLAEDRVSYSPDMHDEVIRDAKDITEAIDKVSKFAAKVARDLKISVEDTDTVKLTLTPNEKEGGNTLSAKVNIAGTQGLSKKNFDNNIIGKTVEGLYASASIEQSPKNQNVLIFKTSGYIDGQFKVDAFETEVPLAAYKGDNGKNTGITVDVDDEKNVISASLNLASEKTNILKLEDGEYIVEGIAKNIKYKDTTVFHALNNQSERIEEIEDSIEFVKAVDVKGSETDSTVVNVDKNAVKGDFVVTSNVKLSNDKSIIISNGGLKADVSATFKKGTSTLIINVGNNEYPIDLSDLAVSVLEKAEYDSVTEEIVLTFRVGDGTKTVRVPVGTLIHDTEVDDTDSIDMTIKSISGGPNRISAQLRIDNAHSDNILTVNSNGAYVSKAHITESVKEEAEARKDEDKKLSSKIDEISAIANSNKDAIAQEISTARAAEKANKDAIAQEIIDARAAEKLLKEDIVENKENIKELTKTIDEEVGRAKLAEQANATAITAEETRAKEAELKNTNAIASEIERAIEKEGDLLEKIGGNTTAINENKVAIAAETERATKAEEGISDNAKAITAEAERAKLAEQANAAAIQKENERALTAETELVSKVENAQTVADNAKTIADKTAADLTVEVGRAIAAEKANTDAIGNEKDRAVEKENDLLEKIQQNSTEIQNTKNEISVLSEEVGGIELKKESDNSYALYVNGTKHGEFTIPKDQFLKSVVYDSTTKELVFTFDTASGETVTRVSIADLVNTYEAGDGLVLNGNAFCVDFTKVASVESVSNEINRAKTAEETIISSVNKVNSELTEIKSNVSSNTLAINTLTIELENEIKRASETENNIAKQLANTSEELSSRIETKANASDVYTREEIITKLADYAKSDDVQNKLDDKLNVVDAQNIYATKDSVQEIKDTYATLELVNENDNKLDGRIAENKEAIDNFNLTYNPATSELVYTNKKGVINTYKLYSGSLIKKGEFDASSNSIILTIENAGFESQITIPVSELVSDLSEKIKTNSDDIEKINDALAKLAKEWETVNSSTVDLVKSTIGDKDTLTANVRIATSNKQAIQSSDAGLYVSNDLEDYTCVFGAEGTISGQDAISKLLDRTNNISSDIEHLNIEELRAQVKTNTSDIAELKNKVGDLSNRVLVNEGNILILDNTVKSYDAKFVAMNKEIEELRDLLNKIIKGDVGELIAEIEKIKKVTGYPTYINSEDMSTRLDKLENSGSYDELAEEIRIINEEKIGPVDGSVDGSIWHELNNIVDAGNF